MLNKGLKETINEKIQNGEFEASDFPDYLDVFCQLGNNIDDLRDEIDGWDRKVQIDMDGSGHYWLAIKDGKFTAGEGLIEDADLVLSASAEVAVRVFSGEQDGETAFLSGALKVQGDLPDAIRFHELLGLVIEEIEY